MKFRAYVINLEHATTRWEHMRSQLELLEIPYTRIEGIYGDRLVDPVEGYNERRYQVLTGKETNKREIGCYFSHIKALKTFLNSDLPYALILEDDASLPENITKIIQEALRYTSHWDLLRLSSSRDGNYLVFGELSTGHKIAFNTKVLKSSAAYLISRKAARLCIEKMLPMRLPYDVALDRDWDSGFRTACIIPFPVTTDRNLESQIPIANRIRFYRATTFHLFHICTHLERIFHRRRSFRQAQKKIR